MRRLFQTVLIGISSLIISPVVLAQGTATEIRRGTLPAACDPAKGQIFFERTSNIVYQCSATNTWERVGSRLTTLAVTGTADAGTLTESTNAVPNATDHLGFFAPTTSAQLDTVISDDTGSGALMFGTSPTVTTSILANATGTDIGSAGTRFDLFGDVVSIGNLNDIRIVDDNKFTTPDLAEADCGSSPCVVLIRSGEATGDVTRSTWSEGVGILDLRGDEDGPYSAGVNDTPFKFLCRRTTDTVSTLDIYPCLRIYTYHDAGGDNTSGGPKDEYYGLSNFFRSAGRGQEISGQFHAEKYGEGDMVGVGPSARHFGNCITGGDECTEGVSTSARQGNAVMTATIDSYTGGSRTIAYSSPVNESKIGYGRYIINTNAAKIYTTGSVSSVNSASPPVVTGSGTAWSTQFGAGAHTDICFSQNDDDATYKFVVPIRSIASDTSLTLDHDPQGSDKGWPGDNNGSSYRIYKCAQIETIDYAGGSFTHISGGTTDWAATDTLEVPLGWAWFGVGVNVVVENNIPSSSIVGVNVTNTGSDEAIDYGFQLGGKAGVGLQLSNTWECRANGVNCNLIAGTTGIKFTNNPTLSFFFPNNANGTSKMVRYSDTTGTTGNSELYWDSTADSWYMQHSGASTKYFEFNSVTGKMRVNGGITSGAGMQHGRVTTGSCATTGCQVTLTWGVTFVDTNYSASCSVEDSTAQSETTGLRLAKISSKTATTILVDIDNFSGAGVTGTLVCLGMHD